MMAFWTSVDRATKEGLKVAWFGVGVAILGRFLPESGWLSWFGIGMTAIWSCTATAGGTSQETGRCTTENHVG
jgi:hypothetical protein